MVMKVPLTFGAFAALPGFCLWLIDGLALSLLLGAICARFRDIPQIIGAIMQIAFFITPVMWQANSLRGQQEAQALIDYNPFVYMLDIVRAPLLGQPLTMALISTALVISVGLLLLAWIGFARCRGRIAFWV
jgi:lipopolysaccharide transport system permease protein